MKIGVIGAGSIGLLFAAYLSKTNEVTVFTRTKEQAGNINQNGICLLKEGRQIKAKITAWPMAEWNAEEDLTIVAVKQYQITPIIGRFMDYQENQLSLLFLQNGMGHLKSLSALKVNNIYVGSVEHGAYKENSFTVRHNGVGMTNIAAFRGDLSLLADLASQTVSDFPVSFHQDYYGMLLNKLIINAVINPITALLHVQNGHIIQDVHYFEAARQLFLEISNVLNLEKPEDYWQRVVDVCGQTANNCSSMLKDIEAGSKTEVDAILGFLIEAAEEKQIMAPLIKTYFHLLKGKEAGC